MSLDIQPKQAGDRITSADFNAIVSAVDKNEQDISGKVDKTQKIAGVDLQDDITKSEMQTALNVEDGAEVNDVVDVQQNDTSVVDGNKVAHIDAYKKEDALELLCPQNDATITTFPAIIIDPIEHNLIDYTINGNTVDNQGVGDLVTDAEDEHYGEYVIPIRVTGKNLYDDSKATSGYIASDGSIKQSTILKVSDYIPALPNTTYVISPYRWTIDSNKYFNCYNASKELISVLGQAVYQNTFTTPSNTAYIRTSVRINDSSTFQLELGTTPTEYEAYKELTTDIYLDESLGISESISFSDTSLNLPSIKLYKGTNNIIFNTTVQPSSVNIKYYQDINKVIANIQATILDYHS